MMKNCELAELTLSPRRAMPTTPRLNGTLENSAGRLGYLEPPVPLKFWPSPVCAPARSDASRSHNQKVGTGSAEPAPTKIELLL